MQNKKDKSSNIQMEYNFKIECGKPLHFFCSKSKIRSTKGSNL